MNKLLLWGGGGAALLALLLFSGKSKAAPNGPPAPGPGPNFGPGNWPKTPFPAIAGVVEGGMRVRSVPNPSAPATTILGTVANGQSVTVIQTGIKAADGSGGEWWQVQAPFGMGYTRAVDPAGVVNWTIPATVTSGYGHPHSVHHRAAWQHAVMNGAHPSVVEAYRQRMAYGGKG